MFLKKNLKYGLVLIMCSCNNRTEKIYFANGKLSVENTYLNGAHHNKRVFYENGSLQWECSYKDNKANGIYKFYDTTGNIQLTSQFENDVQNGLSTLFYQTGEVSNYSIYKNGKIHGPSIDYFKNGKIKKKSIFSEGNMRFYIEYSESGDIENEYHKYEIMPLSDTVYSRENAKVDINIRIFGRIVKHNKVGILYSVLHDSGKKDGVLVFSNVQPAQTISLDKLPKGKYQLSVFCSNLDRNSSVDTLKKTIFVL